MPQTFDSDREKEMIRAIYREQQDAETMIKSLARRQLSRPLVWLMWGLRIYVLFMVGLFIVHFI